MDPNEVAEKVMHGIEENELYIFSDPEWRSTLEEHFQRMLAAYLRLKSLCRYSFSEKSWAQRPQKGDGNGSTAMLDLITYKKMRGSKVKLPKRLSKGRYDNKASLHGRNFVAEFQEF